MEEFWKFRPLLYELVARDIKIKYRRSVLGVLWTILNPLLMMIVLYTVFSRLFRFDIDNYAIYILSGQVVFNYYQSATTEAMTAILGNGSLIKKVYLPKYMLVLSKILSGAVNLAASFLALLFVIVFTGGEVAGNLIYVLLPLVCLIMLSYGIGLILAAVTVRFRDIQHLYGVFCTALFYLTPIIYPFSILPDYMKDVVYFNPVTRIMDTFRDIVMENRIPGYIDIWFCVVPAMVILVIGMLVFYVRQRTFILDI